MADLKVIGPYFSRSYKISNQDLIWDNPIPMEQHAPIGRRVLKCEHEECRKSRGMISETTPTTINMPKNVIMTCKHVNGMLAADRDGLVDMATTDFFKAEAMKDFGVLPENTRVRVEFNVAVPLVYGYHAYANVYATMIAETDVIKNQPVEFFLKRSETTRYERFTIATATEPVERTRGALSLEVQNFLFSVVLPEFASREKTCQGPQHLTTDAAHVATLLYRDAFSIPMEKRYPAWKNDAEWFNVPLHDEPVKLMAKLRDEMAPDDFFALVYHLYHLFMYKMCPSCYNYSDTSLDVPVM